MQRELTDIFLGLRQALVGHAQRIVRDRAIAEDLAQETYLRLFRSAETAGIRHIEAFLHRTTHNLAIDYLRGCAVRGKVEIARPEPETQDGRLVSVEQRLIERQRAQCLVQAMQSLPERARAVLILSRLKHWPNTRIAKHLNVSERTVFNDLRLALAHCHDEMRRYEKL